MLRAVILGVFGLVMILADTPPLGKLLTAIAIVIIWYVLEKLRDDLT